MLAAVNHGPNRMELGAVDDPRCEPGGLVVKVAACAICGTDVRVLGHGQANVKIPQILGHEITGVVAEVGAGVEGFAPGDPVALRPGVACGACDECQAGRQNFCRKTLGSFGYALAGGFAEYVAVPAVGVRSGTAIPLARRADLTELSIFEPLACVLNGQELAGVGLGDTVAVIGAGPIGCMHVVVALLRGASQVFVVDVLGARLELARRFGPDLRIDAREEDPVRRVLEATDGRGVSAVVVAASSGAAQEQAVEMIRPRGRIVFFAGLPHDNPSIRFNSNLLHYREGVVYGVKGSTHRHQHDALGLLATRKVDGRQLITHTVPLAEIHEGFRMVRAGEALKVAITP
jgi:L-iditol 2-dehydrogenase